MGLRMVGSKPSPLIPPLKRAALNINARHGVESGLRLGANQKRIYRRFRYEYLIGIPFNGFLSPPLHAEATNFLSMFIRSVRRSMDIREPNKKHMFLLQSRIAVGLMHRRSCSIFLLFVSISMLLSLFLSCFYRTSNKCYISPAVSHVIFLSPQTGTLRERFLPYAKSKGSESKTGLIDEV